MRRAGAAVALAAATVLFGACAPDGSDVYTAESGPPETRPVVTTVPAEEAAESFPANGEVVEVRALDNSFRVATVEVVAGTEVLWLNGGRNEHDVLPVDESQDWGVGKDGFVPGDEYSHLFDTPGVYPYYCSIHGTKEVGMVGTVIVTAP